MLETMQARAQQVDLVQSIKRLLSYAFTLLLALEVFKAEILCK